MPRYKHKPLGDKTRHFIIYLIGLTILSSLSELILCINQSDFSNFMLVLRNNFLMCGVLSGIAFLFNGVVSRILQALFFIVIVLFLIADAIFLSTLGNCLNENNIMIVACTNPAEAIEFCENFISWKVITCAILTLCVTGYVLWRILRCQYTNTQGFTLPQNYSKARRILPYTVYFIFIIGCLSGLKYAIHRQNSLFWNHSLGGRFLLVNSFKTVPSVRDNLTNATFIYEDEILPDNIVIVIGESFNKHHSSLYGYEKETSPKLTRRVSDSTLYVYQNVTSPSTGTQDSFKYFMTECSPPDNNGWYKSLSIMEMFHNIGYHLFWISNQCEFGPHDTVVSRFSELADTVFFANRFGTFEQAPDGVLLPVINDMGSNVTKKDMVICHLMGSHFTYDKRYTPEFAIYKASDYPQYPERQRETRAKYDNTIVYNDAVVDSIIQIYSKSDAVLFYFSDHGYDVFDTSPAYIGHGRPNEPQSREVGVEIPFMVYVSHSYQERNPSITQALKDRATKPLNTSDFIFMLRDIFHIQRTDGEQE